MQAILLPPTIRESFKESLPDLNLSPASPLETHSLSTTAERTDAPKVWVLLSSVEYTEDAERLVHALRAVAVMNYRLPAIEIPFRMHTEADVVRASTLYLLHPINQTINTRFTQRIFCAAEDRGSGNLRCDFVWKYWNGRVFITVAVLELKNRGMLVKDDWMDALTEFRQVDYMIERARRERKRSFLKGNALPLTKQAAAYALERRTKYVALFDWRVLFLYRFDQMDLTRPRNGVGKWAYGTWAQSDYNPNCFRMILLGWLLQACREAIS